MNNLTGVIILAVVGAAAGMAQCPGGGVVSFALGRQGVCTYPNAGSNTNQLTVSGSVVGTSVPYMDGSRSCSKLTVLSTQLTAGVLTQEIPWLVLPAKSVITWFRMLPNTLYSWASGSNTTMTVSLQQNGTVASPTSYMFPVTSIQTVPSVAGTPVDDIVGVQSSSSHTLSINFLGSQNFSNLNSGGSVEFHLCIFVHP